MRKFATSAAFLQVSRATSAGSAADLPGQLPARVGPLLSRPKVQRHGNDETLEGMDGVFERKLRLPRLEGWEDKLFHVQHPRDASPSPAMRRVEAILISRSPSRPFEGVRPGRCVRPWCELAPLTGARNYPMRHANRRSHREPGTLWPQFAGDRRWMHIQGLAQHLGRSRERSRGARTPPTGTPSSRPQACIRTRSSVLRNRDPRPRAWASGPPGGPPGSAPRCLKLALGPILRQSMPQVGRTPHSGVPSQPRY